MALDPKYGKVTLQRGNVGEDEPVVVFRARDALLPKVMEEYLRLCKAAGVPSKHLDQIGETSNKIKTWQMKNETKVPASENTRRR